MWVNPKYRGTSIGQQLLKVATECASQHGVSIIRLEVSGSNLPAMAFYQSLGFQPIDSAGPQDGSNTEACAQLMQLNLND